MCATLLGGLPVGGSALKASLDEALDELTSRPCLLRRIADEGGDDCLDRLELIKAAPRGDQSTVRLAPTQAHAPRRFGDAALLGAQGLPVVRAVTSR